MSVLWLNGAFGVGKTTVARAVRARVRGAVIVDPERIGWILRRATARGRRAYDFQELDAWRTWTTRAVRAAGRFASLVIVPMTVDDATRRAALFDALDDVLHVVLRAEPATIAARLAGRGSSAWIDARNRTCIPALAALEPHVATDDRDVEAIADEIVALYANASRIAG
ncbi:MAG TPA: AAA family ATPase [Labilithrix sp.]